jgi:hypothetical protein
MLVLAYRLDLLLLLLFISMLKFFIFERDFWLIFILKLEAYCNFIYFIIQKIALFFLNSVYLRHMSTRLHYSVISLKNPFSELSFQWILYQVFHFSSQWNLTKIKEYISSQISSEQFICTKDDQEVCHEQASHMYILDLQTSLIDVIIIRRPLSNL